MTQPATGPVEVTEALAAYAGTTTADPDLALTVAAVNDVVRGLPLAQLTDPDTEEDWPDRVTLGAEMLVRRFWRRRDTPSGVNVATDDGSVLAFARSDPDVALMLEMGAYEKPNRIG